MFYDHLQKQTEINKLREFRTLKTKLKEENMNYQEALKDLEL